MNCIEKYKKFFYVIITLMWIRPPAFGRQATVQSINNSLCNATYCQSCMTGIVTDGSGHWCYSSSCAPNQTSSEHCWQDPSTAGQLCYPKPLSPPYMCDDCTVSTSAIPPNSTTCTPPPCPSGTGTWTLTVNSTCS